MTAGNARDRAGPRRKPVRRTPLYEPLGWALARAPALPVEAYERSLTNEPLDLSAVVAEPRIRRALAVGSSDLVRALDRDDVDGRNKTRQLESLRRYLIRMSTRPTPYGLFAGVALTRWGSATDLELGGRPHCRSRPDMAWLLDLVMAQEARPEVLRDLRLVANTALRINAGRLFVAERAPTGDNDSGGGSVVSLRATAAVRQALETARTPIPYRQLVTELLSTRGATSAKVESLIDQLCRQTVLLTDLRPPLTVPSPAAYVAARLAGIPAACDVADGLGRLLEAMAAWDALPPDSGAAGYANLARVARSVPGAPAKPAVQVDMGLELAGSQISSAVADEAAQAGELLVRLSSAPRGPAYLQNYRHAFVSRYGHDRVVPLLELLDPDLGLGPPGHSHRGSGGDGLDAKRNAVRQQTLRELALSALRDRRLAVELDEQTLARLETWSPQPATAPPSLDVAVFILASSREALDAGDFQVMIGPNLGASAAGRNLGRFADLLGEEATVALADAARAAAAHAPDHLFAEVVYLPHRFRSANVAIRPQVYDHEIVVGTTGSVPSDRVISIDELVVGVRDDRLRVLWPARNVEVIACAGHMLNNANAPAVVRFLEDVVRDGIAQVSGFDWGMASGLTFLPRVQAGRVVLSPAQWIIDERARDDQLQPAAPDRFPAPLAAWRQQWQVPRYVYLTTGDNRLLLDLDASSHVEVLRTELCRLTEGGGLVLQEALPAPEHAWVPGPGGRFVIELVVPVVLRGAPTRRSAEAVPAAISADAGRERLRPPGSDWLYLKVYCHQALEEDLIAGPIQEFCEFACSAGMAEEWFFIRYADPGNHLRIRFRGGSEELVHRLLPEACSWADELITDGLCQGFSFDTYERELERYGGAAATAVAESVFATDSRAVAALLELAIQRQLTLDRVALAVLSVDDLLAGLGLDKHKRLDWYRQHVTSRRHAGAEYRHRQAALRPLLGDPARLAGEPGGNALDHVFATRRAALAPLVKRLDDLAERGYLSQDRPTLYQSHVHLHCNRLMESGSSSEQLVLGLLLRLREGLERAPIKQAAVR